MIFLAWVVCVFFVVWFVAGNLDKQEQNPVDLDQ